MMMMMMFVVVLTIKCFCGMLNIVGGCAVSCDSKHEGPSRANSSGRVFEVQPWRADVH